MSKIGEIMNKNNLILLIFLSSHANAAITTNIPSVYKDQSFMLGFTVFNEALPINNAVFTYGVPTSFNVTNITSTQGSCNVGNAVTCELGTVTGGIDITLEIMPTQMVKTSGVASVRGNTRDCATCDIESYFKSRTLTFEVKELQVDEPTVVIGFSKPGYVVSEGETFTINIDSNAAEPVEIGYYVSSGNALVNDYELKIETITTDDSISVRILNDDEIEKDESFTLKLTTSNPDVELQLSNTKITIVDSTRNPLDILPPDAAQIIRDKNYLGLGMLGIESARWQMSSIRKRMISLRADNRNPDSKINVSAANNKPQFEYYLGRPGQYGAFADGYIGTGDVEGYGLNLGFDYGRNDKFIGMALGKSNASSGNAELDSTNITVFATYDNRKYYLEFLLGYGLNDFNIDTYAGEGEQRIFEAGAGYHLKSDGLTVTPSLSLQNINIKGDGFNDGVLNIGSQETASTIFELGLRTSLDIYFDSVTFTPFAGASYYLNDHRQEFLGSYVGFEDSFNFSAEEKEYNAYFEVGVMSQFSLGNLNFSFRKDDMSDSAYVNLLLTF